MADEAVTPPPVVDDSSDRSAVARFASELKRRRVASTAGFYVVGAWVAMQVAEVLFPLLFEDSVLASQRVLAILVVGFPVALVLAWVFELTPPQLRREASPEEAAARAREEAEGRALRADSLAVLPFENLSADAENAYFSDGITDDVITSIAEIRGLRVLSRTAVMRYKGSSHGTRRIARELGVATLISGSVRRSDSRIRVVAEMVDARTEDRVWSERYDRELGDIFLVQSEIAARVAQAVQRELPAAARRRIETRGTSDPEAYDLYLRARFLWNQRSESTVAESVGYFQRALERDPGFALAHSALADAYAILAIYGVRDPDVLDAACAAAATALTIDPELGEAVATQACVTAVHDWKWAAAERQFLQAIELAPSYATAPHWYAMNMLTPRGRFEDARTRLEEAGQLDPASPAIAASRGIVSFYAREVDSALTEFEAMAERHPRFPLVHFFLGQCRVELGDLEGAVAALREAVRLSEESSETLAALGHALAVAGRNEEAEAILRRLEERAERRYVSPATRAQVLLGLGRLDDALSMLEEAARGRAVDLIWLAVRPVYDAVRDSPRFDALLTEVGLLPV